MNPTNAFMTALYQLENNEPLNADIRQWKPHIIRALSESRFRAWSFTIDNTRSVTAIRPNGATREEMQRHLQNQFGADRVTNVRATHDAR